MSEDKLSPWEEYVASMTPERRKAMDDKAAEFMEVLRNTPPDPTFWDHMKEPWNCPNIANHRGPEGPCEDIATCHRCNSFSFSMRPEGETWGGHIADCSLPPVHQSYCIGGGKGHPEGHIRG